ncbi:alanine racemase [Desulfitobacterium metallireducens]|uniref:Alanine racemase n=1 Tax=Desulfitobacterium metallireducens DSM 15288 TaxID=871968 RepID=W0EBQ8_9FIRM|nr:alanine racemase [Desulfitobacterium metallireducens]AHF08295.1 alanine racemase [Desulfitobacterium metallireducens DSM 15288]
MSGTWIEIDLDAILNNYQEIVSQLQPQSRLMAVVKADAYGMGAVEVARVLQEAGCESFAVTTVAEGVILREHGIKGQILVLGPVLKDEFTESLQADLLLTLSSLGQIGDLEQSAQSLGKTALVHIKLETGMGRTGFFYENLEDLAQALGECSWVKPVGIFTHFARGAQRDRTYSQEQYTRFQRGVNRLEEMGISGLLKHVCNSAAFLDYPEWHHDFVRIGTLLIGHVPSTGFAGKLNLKDPWLAKARIVHLRKVPKGTFVGYQSIYRTKKETQLAVIPVGYADGFGLIPHMIPQGLMDFIKIVIKNFLALFGVYLGGENATLEGHTVPVAGKVGMQLTILDVGDRPCQVGDEVIIPLRRTLANARIPRIYRKDKRIFTKREIKEGFLPIDPEYSNYDLE